VAIHGGRLHRRLRSLNRPAGWLPAAAPSTSPFDRVQPPTIPPRSTASVCLSALPRRSHAKVSRDAHHVFGNKLNDGAETDEDITFDEADLERATEHPDTSVREVTEVASAYSSTRVLPDEIRERGSVDIVHDSDDTYRFVSE